jgi:hypothetical protein
VAQSDIWLAATSKHPSTRSLTTTALRYVPERLRSWAATAPSSDILVILCEPDAADMVGLDLLKAVAGRDMEVLGAADCNCAEDDLLYALESRCRPGILLAVGRDRRAAEGCRSLAACAEIAFLHLSSDQLPVVLVAPDGEVQLCASFADVARLLSTTAAVIENGAAEHPGNTGWSSYWSQISLS